jgi:hypothetical protein
MPKRSYKKIKTRKKNKINRRSKKRTKKTIKKSSNKKIYQKGGSKVELTWDENNSYNISFNKRTGVLTSKAYWIDGGGTWNFKLYPRYFNLEEDVSNGIGFSIYLTDTSKKKAKRENKHVKDKITILFTGEDAKDNKLELMYELSNFRFGIREHGNEDYSEIITQSPISSTPLHSIPPSSSRSSTTPPPSSRPSIPPSATLLLNPGIDQSSESDTEDLPGEGITSGWYFYQTPLVKIDDNYQGPIERAFKDNPINRDFKLDDNISIDFLKMKMKYISSGNELKIIKITEDAKKQSKEFIKNIRSFNKSKKQKSENSKKNKQKMIPNTPHPINIPDLKDDKSKKTRLRGIEHILEARADIFPDIKSSSGNNKIVVFDNYGQHCYRNAVYSIFLNNISLRDRIRKLKTEGNRQKTDFITCLKNISEGDISNNSVHLEGPVKGGDNLQINTAMYNFIDNHVSSNPSTEFKWRNFLRGGVEALGDENQKDTSEFLPYFSRALSLLGIDICKYIQIRTVKQQGEEKYWNRNEDSMEKLSMNQVNSGVKPTDTAQLEIFDETHKANDINDGSIFTGYRDIFIKEEKEYRIGDGQLRFPGPITEIKAPYNNPPYFVCLSNNRYSHETYTKDMTRYPILEEIVIPVITMRENKLVIINYKYDCCGVAFHLGSEPNQGHYVSCVKMKNQWYYLNDGHPPVETDFKEFENDNFRPAIYYVSPSDRFTIVTVTYAIREPADKYSSLTELK